MVESVKVMSNAPPIKKRLLEFRAGKRNCPNISLYCCACSTVN